MNNLSQLMPIALTPGSFETYVYKVNQIPMLTLEEEQALANRWHLHHDVEAARRLVMSHLRFVVKIARGYLGYGLPLADLVQEGNIGLMKAVKRFDPGVGVRLVSFAVHWIRAEIHEYILRNWRIVKVATTKAQRKLFFNLRKAAKRLGWFSEQEIHDVAEELKVKPEDVRNMEMRLNSVDIGFDAPVHEGEDVAWGAPVHYLEDHSQDPEAVLESQDWSESRENKLQKALALLDERSRTILEYRWLADKKLTLHDLSAKFGVSAERIRQLEVAAMKRLKEALA